MSWRLLLPLLCSLACASVEPAPPVETADASEQAVADEDAASAQAVADEDAESAQAVADEDAESSGPVAAGDTEGADAQEGRSVPERVARGAAGEVGKRTKRRAVREYRGLIDRALDEVVRGLGR